MDDRAFAYLSETPVGALMEIFETFRPKRLDDTDYSAPVITYAKKCRERMGVQGQFGHVGFANGCGGYGLPSHGYGAGHGASIPRSGGRHAGRAQLDAFCRRYPV